MIGGADLQVLSPKNVDPKLLADGDISGLLLYGTALGLCHLLVRTGQTDTSDPSGAPQAAANKLKLAQQVG